MAPSDAVLQEFYVMSLEDERDAKDSELNAIWATVGAPEGLSPLQAVERQTARIAALESDLEHALASVGAFRAAIEEVWSKSAGESGDDGFIVSYVIPVGVLHRAIGIARGTDAGGKLLAERDALRARAERSEAVMPLLVRQVRATYGIIHEGLHGGKATDPDHQEACEMPSCRNARAALAASDGQEGRDGE